MSSDVKTLFTTVHKIRTYFWAVVSIPVIGAKNINFLTLNDSETLVHWWSDMCADNHSAIYPSFPVLIGMLHDNDDRN